MYFNDESLNNNNDIYDFEFSKDQDDDTLKEVLKTNVEKPCKLLVYSSKTRKVRGKEFNFICIIIIKCMNYHTISPGMNEC